MKFPRSVFENTLQMERPQKVDYVSASYFLVESTGITLNPTMVQRNTKFPQSVFENTLQMERPQNLDYVSAYFLVESTRITLNPTMVH